MKRLLFSCLFVFVASSTAMAEVRTETVAYEHDGTKLEGFFAWDDSIKGARPGVLVVHEWWGLNDYARKRATQLAELGYVAFALDMYGQGKVTQHPKQAGEWAGQIRSNSDAWVARAMAGLKLLENHRMVDQSRMAAIGYCFGGSTVQQLAYAKAPLKCVVSFHGSPVNPPEGWAGEKAPKVLMCHGAQDQFISFESIESFQKAMDASGADWQFVSYSGARHGFTNPDAGDYGLENLKYDRHADQRSWQQMQALFKESFESK